MKNINIYQNNIDQKYDRDRHEETHKLERAKAFEEREKTITNDIDTQQEIQQAERDDAEIEDFQQHKKPRTEEKQVCQNNLLTLLRKERESISLEVFIRLRKGIQTRRQSVSHPSQGPSHLSSTNN
eukprot:9379165-Heterocapsa_arctica.AAC.1